MKRIITIFFALVSCIQSLLIAQEPRTILRSPFFTVKQLIECPTTTIPAIYQLGQIVRNEKGEPIVDKQLANDSEKEGLEKRKKIQGELNQLGFQFRKNNTFARGELVIIPLKNQVGTTIYAKAIILGKSKDEGSRGKYLMQLSSNPESEVVKALPVHIGKFRDYSFGPP